MLFYPFSGPKGPSTILSCLWNTIYSDTQYQTKLLHRIMHAIWSCKHVQNTFSVPVELIISPSSNLSFLPSHRMYLRSVSPKCLMIQRRPHQLPLHHQPSTLHPLLDKPHPRLPFQKRTALVLLIQSPQEETRSKNDNNNWLSYRNRLELSN